MGRWQWHVIGAVHSICINFPGGARRHGGREVNDQEGLAFTAKPGGAKEGHKGRGGE